MSEVPNTVGNHIAQLLTTENHEMRLTQVEIDEYLAKNGSNAVSLIVAFEALREPEYLKLAAASFPNNPLVQAKVIAHDIFPEDRWQWIEAFKQSAAGNSFPNFLAARELMDSGDAVGALREIREAMDKTYNDYTRESIFELERAYHGAERSDLDSKALASSGVHLPQFAALKSLASQMADLANSYGSSGDNASKQALLEGAWEMGTQLRMAGQQGILLSDLVGLAMQNLALQRWPPGVPAPFIENSVSDQLLANRRFRQELQSNSVLFDQWLSAANESDIIHYFDRLRTFGELNAMRWLREGHPELVAPQTVTLN